MDRPSMTVYVGTYTDRRPNLVGQGEGIYVYAFDPASGALDLRQTMRGLISPSYLTLGAAQRHLYAVEEVVEYAGTPGGAVSALAIDPRDGALTWLNRQSSRGAGPCHLMIDGSGRWLGAANYRGGSVVLFPIQPDGRLGIASDFIQHTGASVNPTRQQEPHAHSLTFTPDNRFALVADLGIDRLLIYRLDAEGGRLLPHQPPATVWHPGAGPRHLDLHPNGRTVYVVNELDSTLTVSRYDPEHGHLTPSQTLPTVPGDFAGRNSCADIHVSPDGRFVYSSNRGHDRIARFAVDPATGQLTALDHTPTGGQTPRNFAIDPTGRWLLVANQTSNTVVSFAIDPANGALTPAGPVASVPTPTCLKFRVVANLAT